MAKLLVMTLVFVVACAPAQPSSSDGVDGAIASNSDSGPGGQADARPVLDYADAQTPEPCEKIDFLFVIDNSGSMQEEQTNLIANFPAFAQLIDQYVNQAGSSIDYRIAVTTAGRDVTYMVSFGGLTLPVTEPGDNGEFRRGCGLGQPWIARGDADMSSKFSCIANVGTTGPGIEMPLLGMEWSLNQRMADGTNAGFLRDDALLAIIILSDQDDCSREDDAFAFDPTQPTCNQGAAEMLPLAHYVDFVDGLAGGRGRWATAVIAGPGPGRCQSQFGEATNSPRLQQFVDQVGDNASFSSICEGDLTGALNDALSTFQSACESFPPIP